MNRSCFQRDLPSSYEDPCRSRLCQSWMRSACERPHGNGPAGPRTDLCEIGPSRRRVKSDNKKPLIFYPSHDIIELTKTDSTASQSPQPEFHMRNILQPIYDTPGPRVFHPRIGAGCVF